MEACYSRHNFHQSARSSKAPHFCSFLGCAKPQRSFVGGHVQKLWRRHRAVYSSMQSGFHAGDSAVRQAMSDHFEANGMPTSVK